jgi:hypothetical protein
MLTRSESGYSVFERVKKTRQNRKPEALYEFMAEDMAAMPAASRPF